MVALLLPMAVSAQMLTTDLQPNQKIMGHYTTDELAANGWGKTFFSGVMPIATDITPDELALFQGSKIVAFRVGLSESAPITRVFVIPVDGHGQVMDDEQVEWTCSASDQGWNVIELETPYLINLPGDYSLRIGFDYEQPTKQSKPISAVPVGTTYPTYHYKSGKWMNYGVNTNGNLSLQCICENDNFPQYIIRLKDLRNKGMVKIGDELTFSFEAYGLGASQVDPGQLTFDIAIDGVVVKTISNPVAIGSDIVTISDVISTEGLTTGAHTLTVTTATLYGEPMTQPVFLSSTFKTFENGFTRQMHLVEQFTSTGCTWCPLGTENIRNLTEMRDDIAWVSVHENMNNTDPYRTAQTDSITSFEGIDGFPEGTFDRTVGIEGSNYVYAVISGLPASTMSTFLDYVDDNNPAWATVNINSTYDASTRKAVITINGELVPNFDQMMGSNSKLTVYITEDGLVAPQINQGVMENNYVHNNVLRKALVSVKGVALKKTGDSYKNEFTYTIPSSWKAENLSIVAFISRPLGNPLTDIYVNNANKRKLGEYDEPTTATGDVDGDGIVNISDVTALIDMLLSGNISSDAADVDGDGIVNISDVTALIDMLLSGVN